MSYINSWAQAILNLSRPLETQDEFNQAIEILKRAKILNKNIDDLVSEICTIKNNNTDLIEYNDKNYFVYSKKNKEHTWKYLIPYWLSGRIKKVATILGAKTKIRDIDELSLQQELTTYSYYQIYKLYMQYDNAYKAYPELAVIGTTAENLKNKIPQNLQTVIEQGISKIEKLFLVTTVYGTICMFSTESNIDTYNRLHKTLSIAPGCYRVSLNKSNQSKFSTCKIVGRSCENQTTLNSCADVAIDPDNRDGGGSNPEVFLNYLVYGNTNGNKETQDITTNLNASLKNKLTDRNSILKIMGDNSDVLIVYKQQLLSDPTNDCAAMDQKYGVVGLL